MSYDGLKVTRGPSGKWYVINACWSRISGMYRTKAQAAKRLKQIRKGA